MYQPTFADAFAGKVRAGQYDKLADQLGLVSVYHDSTTYYYRRRRVAQLGGLRAFKRWFESLLPRGHVVGTNGSYSVE